MPRKKITFFTPAAFKLDSRKNLAFLPPARACSNAFGVELLPLIARIALLARGGVDHVYTSTFQLIHKC